MGVMETVNELIFGGKTDSEIETSIRYPKRAIKRHVETFGDIEYALEATVARTKFF